MDDLDIQFEITSAGILVFKIECPACHYQHEHDGSDLMKGSELYCQCGVSIQIADDSFTEATEFAIKEIRDE